MSIYTNFVFTDKLISPVNGKEYKRVNAQNIRNFGFSSIEELHTLYPNFPLRCEESAIKQLNNNKIMAKGYIEHSNKLSEQAKDEYYINPKYCPCCNTVITFEKKENTYCDHVCAAKVAAIGRVVSEEHKKNLSDKMTIMCQVSFCEICKSTIRNKRRKTCSPECTKQSISNNKKNPPTLLKYNNKPRIGYKNNRWPSRTTPSYMERTFDEWLKTSKCNYSWIMEQPFKRYDFNGKYLKCYYADFYFPELNLIIELDGTQHERNIEYDKDRDNYIINNYSNVSSIIRIKHKEFMDKSYIDEISSLLNIS